MRDDETAARPDGGNSATHADNTDESEADHGYAGEPAAAQGSVTHSLHDLIDDGRSYLEAELAFQKSRFGFALDSGRWGLVFGGAALAFLHLALIALVVGMVIALGPVLGTWGAMGSVTGVLLVGTVIFGLLAKSRFGRIGRAFEQSDQEESAEKEGSEE